MIDESVYADAQLASMRNLAAALFRLENSQGPEAVRTVLTALTAWLTEPDQEELQRSFLLWLREGFLPAQLPTAPFLELNNLEEVRNMLSERVVDWTQQWKQEGWQEGLQRGLQQGLQQGLQGERRLLQRQIRRRFGEAVAVQSLPVLERIEQQTVFEDLGEALLDCVDEVAWLARLKVAAKSPS